MANGFYDYFIQNLLKATTTQIDFDSATLKLVLTDHGTDFHYENTEFFSTTTPTQPWLRNFDNVFLGEQIGEFRA
jgi:hypothetical protein